MDVALAARVGRRLRAAWRSVGLFCAMAAVTFAAAAYIHHVSVLPRRYTWL